MSIRIVECHVNQSMFLRVISGQHFSVVSNRNHSKMIQFMLMFSRQGKLRLQKWYVSHPDKVKKKITRELITTILAR